MGCAGCKCFTDHDKSQPVVAEAPVEVQSDSMIEALGLRQQLALDAVPLGLRLFPQKGISCAHISAVSHGQQGRLVRVAGKIQWTLPNCRGSSFHMGFHMLPTEQGQHLHLPRHRRICNLCRSFGDISLMRSCFLNALPLLVSGPNADSVTNASRRKYLFTHQGPIFPADRTMFRCHDQACKASTWSIGTLQIRSIEDLWP